MTAPSGSLEMSEEWETVSSASVRRYSEPVRNRSAAFCAVVLSFGLSALSSVAVPIVDSGDIDWGVPSKSSLSRPRSLAKSLGLPAFWLFAPNRSALPLAIRYCKDSIVLAMSAFSLLASLNCDCSSSSILTSLSYLSLALAISWVIFSRLSRSRALTESCLATRS